MSDANGVEKIDTAQQPKNDMLDDVAFAANAAPFLVINVRVQRGMELFKSNAEVLIPFKVPVNDHAVILAAQLCLKSCDCQGFNFGILKVLGCPTHDLQRNFALMLGIPSSKDTSECALSYELQIFISIDLADAGVDVPVGVNIGSWCLNMNSAG